MNERCRPLRHSAPDIAIHERHPRRDRDEKKHADPVNRVKASLEPGVQHDADSQSKLPKRKWISANTREYEFAAYMQAWVAKVERVGNLNYPEEVRRQQLTGDLLMTVGINQDGSVESIDIMRSSGLPQLDNAATRIVRLAGPYSPLPEYIKGSVDVLHITRTWRFSRDFKGLD